jgi:hypothetical protein
VKDAKGNWRAVETADAFSTKLDQYNTVHFKPVKTKAIRIQAQLGKNVSAGILEWKIND